MSLSTNVSLTVNDYDIKLSRNLKFYENDQLKLVFTVNYWGVDNANGRYQKTLMPLNALSAILFIETPLGVDSIESANVEDNVVTFYLTSNQTQHIGVSRMQIQLSDEDGCQITLPPFTFEIRENIYNGEILLTQVLLSDEDSSIIVDENENALNVSTQMSTQTYAVALASEETETVTSSIPTKQIKDFDLKVGVDGTEDLLIQDNGITKRIKTSELIDTVTVDISICYTKEEVNALLENKADVSHTHVVADITDLSIPTVDVDKAYVDEQLETKANVSDIPDLTGYATETYVQGKIAEAQLSGEIDLSEYATKDDLLTKADSVHTHTVTDITDLVIPTVDVDKNYVDTQLATKANISDIPTVPTKTSDLVNDSGFITVDEVPNVDLSGYAPTDSPNFTGDVTIGNRLQTSEIGESSLAVGHDVTASGEYSYSQGFNTVASGKYSHAEGWETIASGNSQHVQGRFNIEDSKNTYAHIVGNGTSNISRSNAHTLDWDGNVWFAGNITIGLDNKELATQEYVDNNSFSGDYNDLTNKPTIPTVPTNVSELTNDSGYITSIPDEYITETELTTALSTKANTSDIPSLDGYATETYVTNKIAEAQLDGGEVDLSGYATKDELNAKADAVHTHSSSDITGLSDVATSGDYDDLLNKPIIPTVDVNKEYVDTQLSTKANISDIPDLTDYALKTEIPTVPAKTSDLTNDSGFLTSIPDEYVTETELNAKGYLTEHQDISGKANTSDLSAVATTGSYDDLINKPVIPSAYTLPTANSTTLGGVKIGDGLSIDINGVLSTSIKIIALTQSEYDALASIDNNTVYLIKGD